MDINRHHVIHKIITAIMDGEAAEVLKLIEYGLKKGMSTEEILEEALIPASRKLADTFQGANFYIPDVLLASRAIKAGTYALKPFLPQKTSSNQIKVLIGTVEGDIHDIGKNLISMFFEFAGFEVIDLGVNITPLQFMQEVKKHQPDILAMSAILTTTMGSMSETIDLLSQHKLRDKVKILVGGGPVTKEFARSIGADGSVDNPKDAVKMAQKLITGKKRFDHNYPR